MKVKKTPAAVIASSRDEALGQLASFFIEQRGGRRLIGHSGSQNGFISHLYLDPEAGAGYVVSFNTEVNDDAPVPITRKLDAEVREFYVARVAPVLQNAAGVR